MKGWRFSTKLTALVLASCVLPCFVLWMLGYWALTQSARDSTENLLSSLAQQSARQVQLWLEEQAATARAVARSPDLLEQWRLRAEHPPRSDEHFLNLYRLHQIISLCNTSSQWITEVRLAEPNGLVFLSDNTAAIDDEVVPTEARVDLKDALAGKSIFTSLFIARDPGLAHIDSARLERNFPTMFVVTPVRGEGRTVGLLSCRLAVGDVARLFSKEANNVPLDIFLLDAQGRILSSNRHADTTHLYQQLPRSDSGRRFPEPGSNLRGYANYDDHPVVGSWGRVNGTDLYVLVQAERRLLFGPVGYALSLTSGTALLLCLLSAIAGLLTARRLLRPLRHLTRAAHGLAEGQRHIRVQLRRGDEIGELGDTFDRMSASLETTMLALEAARDEALTAYRAKSRFLANMTHELRTPLHSIIGYSEMLLGELEDAGHTQWLDDLHVIRKAGKGLLDMINGILDLSKVEAGKMNVDWERFSLAELFAELQLLLDPLLRERSNQLYLEVSGGDTVCLDRLKTRQILLNLLSNSNKFTQAGTLRLTAEVGAENITLSVSDTGIGMTEEQCKRVFEEFSQADDSTTRKYGGTGLGLTIVRRFTELMGGTVQVSSLVGEGTTFRIVIPVPAPSQE